MGVHLCEGSRDLRQTRAHLDRKENGDIYAVLKLSFKKDAKKFEYCFIGSEVGRLTFEGEDINRHPKFKNIGQFEDWCNRYTATHDIK